MESIININRFLKLLKLDFVSSYKIYLYVVIGLTTVFALNQFLVFYDFIIWKNLFNMICLLTIILAPVYCDNNLREQNLFFYLMLPVSSFEKILVLLIKCMILIPVVVILTCYLLSCLSAIFILPINASGIDFTFIIRELLIIQLLFLLGYVSFKKSAFFKTGLTIAVTIMAFTLLSSFIFKLFFPQVYDLIGSMDIYSVLNCDEHFYLDKTTKKFTKINISITPMYEVAKYIFISTLYFGVLIITFLKLKEKEI